MAAHGLPRATLGRRRFRIRRRLAAFCGALCLILIAAVTFAVPGAYVHRTGPMDLAPSLLRLQARFFPTYDRLWRRFTGASNATRTSRLFEHTILAKLQNDYTGPLHYRGAEGVYAQEGSAYPPSREFWSLYPTGLTSAGPQGMFAFSSFPESGPWSVPTVDGQQLLALYKPLQFPPVLAKEGWVGGFIVDAIVPPPSTAINVPKLAAAGGSVLGSLGLLVGLSAALEARERRRRRAVVLATCDDLIYAIEISLEFRALDSDSPIRQRYTQALELYAAAQDGGDTASSVPADRAIDATADRVLYLLTDVQTSLGTESKSA